MKKMIKVILIALLVIAVLLIAVIAVLIGLSHEKNNHYYKYTTTGGDLEAKYTALGSYSVSFMEFDTDDEVCKKFSVWYPTEMKDSKKTYPMVVIANGTGSKASAYSAVFEHLASWGFIVIGNDDENSRTGASSAATLEFMLKQNEDDSSIFFGKINTQKVGISGHSQGGVGSINAVTAQENGSMYKAMYVASPTSNYWGQEHIFGKEWSYDVSKISIPCFIVAGTGAFDSGTATSITATEGQGICPLWDMEYNYNTIPASVNKVMGRLVGKDHGDLMYCADGYMTAWFMYWLNDDEDAGKAFFGENAEIYSNKNWQDVRTNGY